MKKHSIVVRMSAARWEVELLNVGVTYDLKHMSKDERHEFVKTFVRSFREQRIAA